MHDLTSAIAPLEPKITIQNWLRLVWRFEQMMVMGHLNVG